MQLHHAADQRSARNGFPYHPLLGVAHRVAYVANRGLVDGFREHPAFADVLAGLAARPMRKDSVRHAYQAAVAQLDRTGDR